MLVRTIDATKKHARAAGVLYLLLALTAPFGLVYVPAKLMVAASPTETADRIRASESLLRMGIASELVHQVIAIFLVLALYRLFEPVSQSLARLVVILGALVSVPIVFVNVLNEIAALYLVGSDGSLSAFDGPQRDALAFLFLRLHDQGIQVAAVFWGLWLFPFGALVTRSRFIPRVLGFALMMAGLAYLATSFTALCVPRWFPPVDRVGTLLKLGELPIVVWLVIWGAREAREAGKP